ncbi:MAG: hypothetical protein LBV20_05410 [Treponema sp.]|nr:hypothetical protein [Treponema sp.]
MNRMIQAGFVLMFLIFSCGVLFSFGQKDKAEESPLPVDLKEMETVQDSQEVPVVNAIPKVYDSGYYNTAVDGQEVIITGTVRLVGSEPFPRYVFTEAGKYDWYIPDAEDRKVISRSEQQTLTIKGIVALREIIWANGKSGGMERNLKSISLVE